MEIETENRGRDRSGKPEVGGLSRDGLAADSPFAAQKIKI